MRFCTIIHLLKLLCFFSKAQSVRFEAKVDSWRFFKGSFGDLCFALALDSYKKEANILAVQSSTIHYRT